MSRSDFRKFYFLVYTSIWLFFDQTQPFQYIFQLIWNRSPLSTRIQLDPPGPLIPSRRGDRVWVTNSAQTFLTPFWSEYGKMICSGVIENASSFLSKKTGLNFFPIGYELSPCKDGHFYVEIPRPGRTTERPNCYHTLLARAATYESLYFLEFSPAFLARGRQQMGQNYSDHQNGYDLQQIVCIRVSQKRTSRKLISHTPSMYSTSCQSTVRKNLQ